MTIQRKEVALIGAGMVAGSHVHSCLDANEIVRLKGILSRSGESANALAQECSAGTGEDVIVYNSIDEIAADPDVDFAIIATPPNVRAEVIKPLIAAGKHILLEKPIGRTAEESQAIVDMCHDAGVTLGIVFQHRTKHASKAAAALIKGGTLGELGVVEFNIPWWRAQDYYDELGRGTYARDGGGVLISQAIHTIDLGLSLTGPVRAVTAMAKTSRLHNMEAEDFVVAGLEFANGAVGSLSASTASFPGRAESITLHFSAASLLLEGGVLTVTWRDGTREVLGEASGTGGGADPMAFSHASHQAIIENFAHALNGEAELYVSGARAMAAHALIDAILRAARTGTKQEVGL